MRSPFHRLLADAERDRPVWVPIRTGMFEESLERFREIATSFGKTTPKALGVRNQRVASRMTTVSAGKGLPKGRRTSASKPAEEAVGRVVLAVRVSGF